MDKLYSGFQMKLIKKYSESDNTKYLFNNGYGAIVKENEKLFEITLIKFNLDTKDNKFTYELVDDAIIPCISIEIPYNELLNLLDDISALSHREYIKINTTS